MYSIKPKKSVPHARYFKTTVKIHCILCRLNSNSVRVLVQMPVPLSHSIWNVSSFPSCLAKVLFIFPVVMAYLCSFILEDKVLPISPM